jgi:zinc and cadmium transporter
MSPIVTLVIYCALILVVSVVGGMIPAMVRLTHRRLQFGLALVAGVMLGVGLLHMLGHAVEMAFEEGEATIHGVMLAALCGFLLMFLLERFFCFHHHETEDEHGRTCGHTHDDGDACEEDAPSHSHAFGWMGAFFGLSIHTLIAGFALGAAVYAAAPMENAPGELAGTFGGLLGFGVFLGIILHKPFDSFTVVALMRREKMPALSMHLINTLFALIVPLGAVIFLYSADFVDTTGNYTALALAFSAGTFICIAASDLLPELQFHDHDRLGITLAFILGLAIAWGSGLFEPEHQHQQGHNHQHEKIPVSAETIEK